MQHRKFLCLAAASCLLLTASGAQAGDGESCGREAFAAAIAETNTTLSRLNDANKQTFQEKLLTLKAKSGWSDTAYLAQAARFVQDEHIADYDARGAALLARLSQLGGGETLTAEKRCAVLDDLKSITGLMVANMTAKWAYMQDKIGQALSSTVQAKAGP